MATRTERRHRARPRLAPPERDADASRISLTSWNQRRRDARCSRSCVGTEPAAFTATDIADARLSRQFASFKQMAEEHKDVRIWGGIHFRNSLDVGEGMGRKIADHLVANYMKLTQSQ